MIPDFIFFTSDRMMELWHNLRVMLIMVSPILLIWIAIHVVGYVADAIKRSLGGGSHKDYDEREDDY